MAAGWEMGYGMGFGSSSLAPVGSSPAYLYGLPSADVLRIDDLLDFSGHDEVFPSSSSADPHLAPHHPEQWPLGKDADSSSNQYSYSSSAASFADDLYIPSEEAAELEWLSRFVDDSFSDVPYSSAYNIAPMSSTAKQQHLRSEQSSSPCQGARSKHSRSQSSPSTTSSSSSSDFPMIIQKTCSIEKNITSSGSSNKGKKGGIGEETVRRCTHCASEKTPQWRTGPLGPKTLCNACGVRYKSGRLVPEYRPAASPTFVLTQHSNSHRKVLELRRQKELLVRRENNLGGGGHPAAGSNGVLPELLVHDYEVR